jgi:alcohol dehydrogenase (NADP+)
MLKLAADRKIQPLVEERLMKNANEAIVDMGNGWAWYGYVLVNKW